MVEWRHLRDNSVGFQAEDWVWLYNPRRRNGCCPKLSSDWKDPYTVVTRINDVVYRIRRGPKRKMKIVHLGHLMKYNNDTMTPLVYLIGTIRTKEGTALWNKPICHSGTTLMDRRELSRTYGNDGWLIVGDAAKGRSKPGSGSPDVYSRKTSIAEVWV